MNLNPHYELQGRHAFLAPSNYHWINYDAEKLDATWISSQAARRGDALHAFASDAITLGIKLPATPEAAAPESPNFSPKLPDN